MNRYDYVILGAGSAGRTAAETLVEIAPDRSILLLDAEDYLPYKRTKVSKNIAVEFTPEAFAVHERPWYEQNGIDLRMGVRVQRISTTEKMLELDTGNIGYESLLLATGARPNVPFPGISWRRTSTLWTIDDVQGLKKGLEGSRRVTVVGMGVLGVEAASQLSLLGLETQLIGQSQRPMAQYLDVRTAGELTDSMKKAGIDLKFDRSVTDIVENADGILLLTDKDEFEADYVVLTMGSAPDLYLAVEAGIRTDRGILVNEALMTSVPSVWAAGDCAEHPDGKVTGLWHSAEHQGRLAALSMAGTPERNVNPPYRLKCDAFGGLWFSGGPVNAPEGPGNPDPAEEWKNGDILWKPRFMDGKLAALSASAPAGMGKMTVKAGGQLLLDAANRAVVRTVLMS